MNRNISRPQKYYIRIFSLGIGILVVLLGIFASISYGAADISISKILTAFTNYDDSNEYIIIRSMRLSRTLIASMVGASLYIAGALMQGFTQNPLAAPGILGINAGAALAVVLTIFGLGTSSPVLITLVAFLGALLGALAVYSLSSLGQGGATPLNLTVAGAAITPLLSSITTGVLPKPHENLTPKFCS